MKRLLLASIVATLAVTTPTLAKEFQVDTAHSKIGFSVTHLQLSEVEGRFNDFSGTIDWNVDKPTTSSVRFEVGVKSVNTDNEKRDDHLRGEDFFDAQKFPKMTFESTSVEPLGENRYNVTGKLTAHGVTKTVTVPVRIKGPIDAFNNGELSIGFSGRFKINRIDYGIGAGWKGGSDSVVGHDVFITVSGEAHE
jgi:polyisoprenoid-binding protein YceI